MSLFKLREWWSAKLGCEEIFGEDVLAVGNVDNSPENAPKLVTGSVQGRIRVHDPQILSAGTGDATSLLLETRLDSPILQVRLGRLIPNSKQDVAIAVLHPRKLAVYTCRARSSASAATGDAEGGGGTSHFELVPQYIHRFYANGVQFTAYSLCLGPFGGARDHDLMLVQSMDCRITIYENDAEAFSRRLQDCLTPGPFEYIACADAFVMCTPALLVKCYKYQVLATSTDQDISSMAECGSGSLDESTSSSGITTRRVVTSDWTCNVGEPIRNFAVARLSMSSSACDVIALGERTLFVLSITGTIKAVKLLDFEPVSLSIFSKRLLVQKQYVTGEEQDRPNMCNPTSEDGDACDNLILGASDARVIVLSNTLKIIWATRGAHSDGSSPLAIAVCDVLHARGAAAGMLVVLDDSGRVSLQ